MENKFLYKKLEEKDFKSIVDVYENCFSEPPRNEIINREAIFNTIMDYYENGCFWGVFFENFLIGIMLAVKQENSHDYSDIKNYFEKNNLSINKEYYYIYSGCVLKEFRGSGVYNILSEYLYNDLFSKGVEGIYTRSRNDVVEINNFLIKKGFKKLFNEKFTINDVESLKTVWELDLIKR